MIFTPRAGTISAWSSKAQDIFNNIGIKRVLRIERFKAFFTPEENKKIVKSKLFDRMTESLFEQIDETVSISIKAKERELMFSISIRIMICYLTKYRAWPSSQPA